MPWYVVYTSPRAEKKVAEQLSRIGIENYCPTLMQLKQWSDRKKKVETPLFSSYVFVRLEEENRNAVFQARGVIRYLFWLEKPAIVRDEEIKAIRDWLSDTQLDLQVARWQPGDRMKLSEGPFRNQEGTIKEINANSISLILEAIGVVLTIRQKQ